MSMATETLQCILLVEDNPDHAELTMDAIQNCNVVNPIVWVEDGESALDFLHRRGRFAELKTAPPAMVLLDIKLPGMDGLAVLREIRSNEVFTALPVIMLTTSQQEGEVIQAYLSHANSYVVKPMNFADFHRKVQELNVYWTLTNHAPGKVAEQWHK